MLCLEVYLRGKFYYAWSICDNDKAHQELRDQIHTAKEAHPDDERAVSFVVKRVDLNRFDKWMCDVLEMANQETLTCK